MGSTENSQNGDVPSKDTKTEAVNLKKDIGFFPAVTITIGTIIGTGIFVSPVSILDNTKSVGASLVLWVICGLIAITGAMVYAEMGTMITKAGGEYIYIKETFGQFASFLVNWITFIASAPGSYGVLSMTTSLYVLRLFFPNCGAPEFLLRLFCITLITILAVLNCTYVKYVARSQNILSTLKLIPLIMIIIVGIVRICQGHTQYLAKGFEGSSQNPGDYALAIYSGMFSYSGWQGVVSLTEEMKNPYRDLPWAIWTSFPVVITVYLMANIAYLTVLSPEEMLKSAAVAVDFTRGALGDAVAYTIPIFVGLSAIGTLNSALLCSSRMFFAAARDSNLPWFMAMLNVTFNTPIPSLIVACCISFAILFTGNVFALMQYVGFCSALKTLLVTCALFYLRWKKPNADRPIKNPLIIPIFVTCVQIFLLIFTIYRKPIDCAIGLAILGAGIPAYFLFVFWENKPRLFVKVYHGFIVIVQNILQVTPEQGKEK